MQRSKTQRRRVPLTPTPDVAGPFQGDNVVRATEDSLEALFSAENTSTFQQPWQKLDRGARLDRLRKFVQSYQSEGTPLTPAERASLLAAVLRAYELRQLNTKASVEYDPVTATIVAVRGLRERVMPNGLRSFRVEATAPVRATTQRRVKTTDRLSNGMTTDRLSNGMTTDRLSNGMTAAGGGMSTDKLSNGSLSNGMTAPTAEYSQQA